IQEQIIRLSALSSLDNASIKILVCLFLSFPLNAIFKRMPDHYYNFKNYYIIGVSAFYIFEILELYSGFMTLFISSMFTYLITKYYKSKYMPWINFIFLMSHLLLNHIEAQFFNVYDPTKIDITGSQMVLVMKLSSFGWSYYDGLLYEKDKQRFDQTLNTYQKSRVILKHPKLISFLSYCFYYPSLLTGPAFDYADYEKFILTDLFEDVPENKKPGRRRKRKIPKSGRIALYKVFQGIGWAALMVILSSKISPEYFFTTEFQKKTLLYKIWYLYISAFFYRLRYYAVWLIAEGSCILSGIGYNGYDKQKDKFYWNRVQNIDPYAFETSQNVHTGFEAWNMNTNKWLKNYVYLRTVVKRDPITFKPQPGFLSTFATFATSAMWHGTKPGYYLSFITGAFYQTCGKLFRKNLRPLFISKNGSNVSHYKIFYDIISYITTQLAFAYLVQPFVILDFSKSLFVWRQVYFFIHFSILITIFVFSGPFAKPIIKTLKQYHMQDTTIETKKPQEMVKE
ncbi:hypothetical protein PACTADRAFT_25649, partial [Pachysolen tannophilus NRRL Y-2460]